jgi:hypothetical protein
MLCLSKTDSCNGFVAVIAIALTDGSSLADAHVASGRGECAFLVTPRKAARVTPNPYGATRWVSALNIAVSAS